MPNFEEDLASMKANAPLVLPLVLLAAGVGLFWLTLGGVEKASILGLVEMAPGVARTIAIVALAAGVVSGILLSSRRRT